MKQYSLKDLDKIYDLEIERVVKIINEAKAKLVLLQFADGLKAYAVSIVDELREKTNAEFVIWMGSCFGACDFPVGVEHLKPEIDLMIQFGHNELMPSY